MARLAFALAFVVATLLCAGAARAADGTVVLSPAGAKGVKRRHVDRVRASLESTAAGLQGVTLSELDGSELGDGNGAACVIDAACLTQAGAALGVKRVAGVLVVAHGNDFTITFVLVDVGAQAELARLTRDVAHGKLASDPGMLLSELLLVAPAAAPPPPPEAAPEPAPAPTPPPAAETPATTMVAAADTGGSGTRTADATTVTAAAPAARGRTVIVGLHGGALLPRGDLHGGGLVGVDVALVPWPRRGILLTAGLDWTLLAQQDSAFVGPPYGPRSRTELIQNAHIYTLYAGTQLALLRLGPARLHAGGALSLSIARATFEAYGVEQPQNDVRPGVIVDLAVRGAWGRIAWTAGLSWREAIHDLGPPGAFGEQAVSGLLVAAGLGMQL